jgi:hypothetical protein
MFYVGSLHGYIHGVDPVQSIEPFLRDRGHAEECARERAVRIESTVNVIAVDLEDSAFNLGESPTISGSAAMCEQIAGAKVQTDGSEDLIDGEAGIRALEVFNDLLAQGKNQMGGNAPGRGYVYRRIL